MNNTVVTSGENITQIMETIIDTQSSLIVELMCITLILFIKHGFIQMLISHLWKCLISNWAIHVSNSYFKIMINCHNYDMPNFRCPGDAVSQNTIIQQS